MQKQAKKKITRTTGWIRLSNLLWPTPLRNVKVRKGHVCMCKGPLPKRAVGSNQIWSQNSLSLIQFHIWLIILRRSTGIQLVVDGMQSYLKPNTGLLLSKTLRIGLLMAAAIALVLPITAQEVSAPAPAPAFAPAL